MSTDISESKGGFQGDPLAALTPPVSAGGCCGGPATTRGAETASASTCCGTAAEAKAEGSCCGGEAKQEAVASGGGVLRVTSAPAGLTPVDGVGPDVGRMRAMVTRLASNGFSGRRIGTGGGRAAAAWLAGQPEQAG